MIRPWQMVALCALALLTLGVVMVNSAGMHVSPVDPGQSGPSDPVTLGSILFSRSSAYMLLAVGALAACAALPVRRWLDTLTESDTVAVRPLAGLGFLCCATAALVGLVLLVYVPGLSREVNGSTRWIGVPVPGLGALSVQPSELAKWGLPALLAAVCAMRLRWMPKLVLGMTPCVVAIGLVCLVVVIEDLGTAALIGFASCAVLVAGGVRIWHLLLLTPIAAMGFIAALVTSPYRVQRLVSFVDPWADPQGTGYHMLQSLQTVAGGEVWGRGLGHGLQKFGYLPEDTTDFLFAVICEELGIAGAALVVLLQGGLVLALLSVALREKAAACQLLIVGVLATIGGQAAINLAVVTGLGPTKGIALPLVSAGGTGWVLTCASLGLVMSIGRTQPQLAPVAATEPESTAHVEVRRGLRGSVGDDGGAPEVYQRDRSHSWA